MREILLVTHPEATHHVEGRVGGWHDSELTPRGRDQADRIADAVAARVPAGTSILTSDLRRTRQTADAVAARVGGRPVAVPELREKSYGEGEGQPDAWFRERFVPPPAIGERMHHDEGLAGAETKAEWVARVYRGMGAVMADPAPHVVVVTHGGSGTFVIARWIGMPLTALDVVAFRLPAGSITHLVEDDVFHNRTVATLGDTAHLLD
ncbi:MULTISPECIES: histidine phosphatase family protein [Clavibacter]|uniref:Phosphoglycerate kinase n=1 Tax=Clavibacter tessellarius TaxID=31965 RepID=A0A154UZJ7_9MICO|nr:MULTISPECIES: histidine phosphatase family protein [Clavibacter]KZC94487.1 phosphoglycerate kinase [Clavibacter michiganensis subsp. tessellarius]MDA3805793.1 histidine phosphatase family protein [Clavibacter sp. CT19]